MNTSTAAFRARALATAVLLSAALRSPVSAAGTPELQMTPELASAMEQVLAAQLSPGPPPGPPKNVPAPGGGLGGNSNYIMTAGSCQHLTSVSVTVNVTQDIVTRAGFSFQLNATSPSGAYAGFQQFCMGVGPSGNFWAGAEIFAAPGNTATDGHNILNYDWQVETLPSIDISSGYQFTISASAAQAGSDNISQVAYSVIDNTGKQVFNV